MGYYIMNICIMVKYDDMFNGILVISILTSDEFLYALTASGVVRSTNKLNKKMI